MSRHSSRSRRNSRVRHRGRRMSSLSLAGGGANYTSAATYGGYVNGDTNAQFNRVFDQGGSYGGRESNVLIGAQGQWAQSPGTPSAQNMSLIQSAGKSRKRRGGFLGPVINQAIVPFSLLAMQQSYRRKRGGKTRRRRRR
jgi:hypothetical protein